MGDEPKGSKAESKPAPLSKRILKEEAAQLGKDKKGTSAAHVPATLLTVEYVDASEGMESALQALEQRLRTQPRSKRTNSATCLLRSYYHCSRPASFRRSMC